MKVAQEIDVDNVTIIINPQNKLEAKIPTSTPSEVVIEEVPNVTPANAVVTLNGTERRITKLGKVSGTEWLVFQLGTTEPAPPGFPSGTTEPTPSDITTDLDVTSCGSTRGENDHYRMSTSATVVVTTSNTGGKTPRTVKFDVKLGSQTRTYTYPYSMSNTYEWRDIGDFSYEGTKDYRFGNARVEFTDGSSSLPSSGTPIPCAMLATD